MEKQTNIFSKLAFISVSLVVALLPIFFLPFSNVSVKISKGLLLVVGLTFAVVFWAIARFFNGKIVIPKSKILLGGLGVVLVTLASALFSTNPQVSLFGTMFDTTGFWFILAGFLLMLMSSILFRDISRARILLLGGILSSVVLLVFQALHIFLPDALSLGILTGKTGNLLGSWNTLGLFSGFAVLMMLLVIEFFNITKMMRLILQISAVFALVFVAVVGFPLVWELIGIAALIIFIYKVSTIDRSPAEDEEHHEDTENKEADQTKRNFPGFSFFIILVSLMFFISGQFIGEFLPRKLELVNIEARPSLKATMSVTKSVLQADPILGLGPNRFEEAWAMYKPVSVNNTQLWDVAFSSGSGLLLTFTATTGYLGILAWLVFLVLLLVSGVRSIFYSFKNKANWETMAFFVLSLYLFVSAFIFPVGPVMFLYALVFTGVFIGLSATNRENGEISFSFLSDHRKSFFSMMFIVLLIIVAIATASKYVEKFASVTYFGKSLTAASIPEAEVAINRALSLHQNDLYLRTFSQIYLLKLNSLISEASASPTETEQAALQENLDRAIGGAQLAIDYNSRNYLNFQALGAVYQSAGRMGVKESYSKALEAYKAASILNPNNPGLKLSIAVITLANGDVSGAKEYANESLALKGNYIDAYIILSQIATTEGDRPGALSLAQKALALSPLDEALINYVNSLKSPSATSTVTPPLGTVSEVEKEEENDAIEEN